ncbi:MAG TPA: DUF1697 domain-containing protein [Kofleriaceae bacterium]|nr:DUF1697 domain-containing protein [Kofleriaceae bacterium]
MDAHVALLRGINLGGRRMPMKDLAAMFEGAGCRDVAIYIQSGNVVFRASSALAARIPKLIAAAIAERFGFDSPVVTRTAAEMSKVVRANPFLPRADPDRLGVAFLADRPTAARVASLDPARSPPDEFAVVGRDIYLLLPGGFARTKLTNAYFDSKLATISTARNWRTVLKLVEMSGA